MILQALHRLYERRATSDDPARRLAPIGFEPKKIPFILELDREGRLIQIRDTRVIEGKKKIARAELIPQSVKKTSGVAANLLWDTAEYVLGAVTEIKGKTSKPARIAEQHAAFWARIHALPAAVLEDAGVGAVVKFLDALDQQTLARLPEWEEIRTTNPLLSFQLAGDNGLVCQRPAVRAAWLDEFTAAEPDGLCLVTGEAAPIERLHSAVKGVSGAQRSGANIVSFNLDAFNSYGKTQGQNAPVGKPAAAMYTTALNSLLARGSRQRVQVGDASTVFWSEERTALEDDFYLVFGEPAKDDPSQGTDRVKALYESFLSGKYAQVHDADTRFYVLGLAPNAARIAVRFWHVDTVAGLSGRITQHFRDIAITHAPNELDSLSLQRLLESCGTPSKNGIKVPPSFSGEVIRAILGGIPYPRTVLQAAVRRCRTEQAKKDKAGKPAPNVSYERAAIIKASLNRLIRDRRTGEREFTVPLDETNTNTAYRLGRLFAIFEKAQILAADRDLNRTIRDSFFGAAMTSPRSVFPRLVKLNEHHIRDLRRDAVRRSRAAWVESMIGAIGWELEAERAFPAVLALEDQGRFAIGYYHQRQDFRQDFYRKADPRNEKSENRT